MRMMDEQIDAEREEYNDLLGSGGDDDAGTSKQDLMFEKLLQLAQQKQQQASDPRLQQLLDVCSKLDGQKVLDLAKKHKLFKKQ